MKKILIIIFLFNALYSKGINLNPERVITDFNGVINIGKNILCYGDYGIITYSPDYGNSWNQYSIGDKFNIKRILDINGDLFGITNFSIMKSTDQGMNWENQIISETGNIVDFTIIDNNIYILTSNSILTSDLELNIKDQELTELDTEIEYSEITGYDDFLFFTSKNRYFFRYEMTSGKLDKIDLIQFNKYGKNPNILTLSNLEIYNGIIFLSFNQFDPTDSSEYQFSYSYIIESSDNGDSWEKSFDDFIRLNECYKIIDINKIYRMGYGWNNSNIYYPVLTTLDKNLNVDSLTNSALIPERAVYILDQSFFSDLIQLSSDTLIAVGKSKLIVMSYDKGATWKWISSFSAISGFTKYKTNYPPPYLTHFVNEEIYYFMNSQSEPVYSTTNRGITWLPYRYNQNEERFTNLINSVFNNTGQGFIYGYNGIKSEKLVKYTDDYGDTYNYKKDSILILKYHSSSDTTTYGFRALSTKENVILAYNYIINNKIDFQDNYDGNLYSKIFLTDFEGNIIHYAQFDSMSVANIVITEDSILYTLALIRKGYTKTDTNEYFENFYFSAIKSTDLGKTWQEELIVNNLPESKNEYFKNIGSYISPIYYVSPFIIFYRVSDDSKLFTFNVDLRKFDSLDVPFTKPYTYDPFFQYDDRFFAVSENNKIYYTKSLNNQNILWDSLGITDLIYEWDSYTGADNQDVILSTWSDNKQAIFAIGKSFSQYYGNSMNQRFRINYIRLNKDLNTSVNEEYIAENNYLYAFPPYPQPANQQVSSKIYWDTSIDILDDEIGVYDIYGQKVAGKESITIDRLTTYSGILKWDCSGVQSGVYLIHVKHGSRSWTLKVMVNK